MAVITKNSTVYGEFVQVLAMQTTSWTGTVSIKDSQQLYTYATITMEYHAVDQKFTFNIPFDTISNLDVGLYYLVADMADAESGIEYRTVEPLQITNEVVSGADVTMLKITLLKVDGSPAGKPTRVVVNSPEGATVVNGWNGVNVVVSHPIADEVSGAVIGTESISTTTNAAGYAELPVIKGQTVTVSCPSFGKSVTVDTTGLDTIDLSSYF